MSLSKFNYYRYVTIIAIIIFCICYPTGLPKNQGYFITPDYSASDLITTRYISYSTTGYDLYITISEPTDGPKINGNISIHKVNLENMDISLYHSSQRYIEKYHCHTKIGIYAIEFNLYNLTTGTSITISSRNWTPVTLIVISSLFIGILVLISIKFLNIYKKENI